jgi:hypothetical protein
MDGRGGGFERIVFLEALPKFVDSAPDRSVFERREVRRTPQRPGADRVFREAGIATFDLRFAQKTEKRFQALGTSERFALKDFFEDAEFFVRPNAGTRLRSHHKDLVPVDMKISHRNGWTDGVLRKIVCLESQPQYAYKPGEEILCQINSIPAKQVRQRLVPTCLFWGIRGRSPSYADVRARPGRTYRARWRNWA